MKRDFYILSAIVVVMFGAWVYQSAKTTMRLTPTDGTTTSTTIASTTNTGGGQGILPYHSGVNGQVLLGPTCPVERIPPDPQCAPKPYSTLVTIFRQSDA